VSDNNLHVTAPAPLPYPRLVAVVRGGFADEVEKKVRELEATHVHERPSCPYCDAVADVLDLLENYR
jgi:hypothetical protein